VQKWTLASAAIAAVMMCAGLVPALAQKKSPKPDAGAEAAGKVYTLLKDNCYSCHGEPGKKVYGERGQLNYILDHTKLVEKLVNKDKPEDSKLYTECNDGSMPKLVDPTGKVRGSKKLPQADIDLLLTWIKAGAPAWPDPNAAPESKLKWKDLGLTGPDGRLGFNMAEGPKGSIVLYGGVNLTAMPPSAPKDTWVFSSGKWAKQSPKASPTCAGLASMAFDSKRGVTVLWGGMNEMQAWQNATWEWNGTTWAQITTKDSPTARRGAALGFDSKRNMMVLFGGNADTADQDDTWQYDGKNWTKLDVKDGPSARAGAAMAFDAVNKQLLLYGGTGNTDTWLFDGKKWTKQDPASSPKATDGCALASGADGIVMVGGTTSADIMTAKGVNECWQWNGKTWVALPTGPAARLGAGLAPENKGKAFVCFGGRGDDGNLTDTWTLAEGK